MRVIPRVVTKRLRNRHEYEYRILSELFSAVVKAVQPYERTKLFCSLIRSAYMHDGFQKIRVAGFGKAVCSMAKAAEDVLYDLIESGTAITKYGHCTSRKPLRLGIREAGHPLPDENGVQGTNEIIRLLGSVNEGSLVLCLISGGASSLLVAPAEGLALEEKRRVVDLLLRAGADIGELNSVRKHLSRVKGGRLAEIASAARITSLILSDVIGDDPSVIASGPTAPDPTTYEDALGVLRKYALTERVPQSALTVLLKGAGGEIPETPKNNNPVFQKVENIVIGSNRTALDVALSEAEELGFNVQILSSSLRGEARDTGKWLAEKALEVRRRKGTRAGGKICLISGGETTVTVKGKGIGGRNMELALSFALRIAGEDGITLLSAGTDGNDGPTDSAGAFADGETVKKASSIGIDARQQLDDNDSYTFFRKVDQLFTTGPTGTNVMDLQLILID